MTARALRFLAFALVVTACDAARDDNPAQPGAGAALETAAIDRGLVVDPSRLDTIGAYVGGEDQICVVEGDDARRIGAVVEIDDSQRCTARGTISGKAAPQIDLGDGCRFAATFDGDVLRFPAVVPDACSRACTGRATLGALAVSRLSVSEIEARAMRDPDDRPLCG